MRTGYGRLSSLWLVDFEFTSRPGEAPVPLCVVGHELRSGRWVRRWLDDDAAPLDLGPKGVLVAYLASAEVGCYLSLGWRLPSRVLDLFVEHKNLTNGLPVFTHGLLDALAFYGIDHGVDKLDKTSMRALAMRGGPYSAEEKQALLEYCETDVAALIKLLPAMLPRIDLDRALLRGRYMIEVAKMERVGVPVDAVRLSSFVWRWPDLQMQVGRLANLRYENVFRSGVSFSQKRFDSYLSRRDIAWPRLDSGRLKLDGDTFSDMVAAYPELRQLRDARKILAGLRLNGFEVGTDDVNRTMLSPFRSKTGRNQPSSSRFLLGASAWLRHFVKPAEGRAVAYIDYSQQEFLVAAALSGDKAMLAAYDSGDPYLALTLASGAGPEMRNTYKVVMLATLYGMGESSLALALNIQPANAHGFIRQIRKAFPVYWAWSDGVSRTVAIARRQSTCFGWQIAYPHVDSTNEVDRRARLAKQDRTARNWPVQATGAEILRVAVILGGAKGVRICAPVHDAVLIEDSIEEIEAKVTVMRGCMAEAARIVIGKPLRTDVTEVRWPDRYRDDDGHEMWAQLCRMLNLDP